jgi:hypothetical protein
MPWDPLGPHEGERAVTVGDRHISNLPGYHQAVDRALSRGNANKGSIPHGDGGQSLKEGDEYAR